MAPAALRSIHPLGKSPTITGSDRVVAESGAIIDYIAESFGKMAGSAAPTRRI